MKTSFEVEMELREELAKLDHKSLVDIAMSAFGALYCRWHDKHEHWDTEAEWDSETASCVADAFGPTHPKLIEIIEKACLLLLVPAALLGCF